ncbi:MAG: hypothetical protein HC778_07165 [Chamaesiphon sp. CSU_1_12]|nr:hypothetical protein [Chamaesiphon sp. CSU_1_12]
MWLELTGVFEMICAVLGSTRTKVEGCAVIPIRLPSTSIARASTETVDVSTGSWMMPTSSAVSAIGS